MNGEVAKADLRSQVTGVVFVSTHPDRMAMTIRSLLFRASIDVHVGILYALFSSSFRELEHEYGDRLTVRPVGSVSELCNRVYDECRTHLFVIDDVVSLPPDPLRNSVRWMNEDVRISTVSFLSNASDFLSFPIRNLPQGRPIDGHDEISITAALRSRGPEAVPVPILHAAGYAVVISASAMSAVGDLVAPASARFDVAVADFSVRAREKGFVDVVDTATFVARTSDVAVHPIDDTLTYDDRGWLLHRHRSMVDFVDEQRQSGDSAFAIAHQVARVKLNGLRILIDGSCFGPLEVGTQVATLHTIKALAEHDGVAEVCVALPGPVPGYAASILTMAKVRARSVAAEPLEQMGPFDIAYRPFQPTPGWDIQRWKHLGVRLIVSVLDTIAFHNGGYFASTGEWLAYREHLLASVRAVDAVTVISNDVIGQMLMHQFPIERSRVVSVPLGTEHLHGNEEVELPRALAARGFGVGPFALCLGVNYTHKNREIALAAHELVRSHGFELALVLAGAAVPHGTTRISEARLGSREHVFVIPEVSSSERNWLLRHASFVWYPTSAEGFGLVPFEAAAFGTPTVAVDFGPIAELSVSADPAQTAREFGHGVPRLARSWDPRALADTALAFLRDPDLARRHVGAVRAAGRAYRWDRTADTLVALFRDTLAQPKR